MKKLICKIVTLTIAAVLALSTLAFNVSAAGTVVSFSNNKPKLNDTVTVNVTVDAGEDMYGAEFDVKYNQDVLEFVSGTSAAGGAGNIHVVPTVAGQKKVTVSLTFKAKAAGTSSVQVTNGIYATDVEKAFTGATANLTVSDAAKSDNANLKSLSLSKGTLTPKFSANKTNYTATVDNKVTECKVYATAADGEAKVEIAGDAALKVGKNVRTVTVTAPSGAQKTYKITITRREEDDTASENEPVDEPQNNPLETTVDGAAYTVATDISGLKLPNGFTAAEAEYNGAKAAVAEDKGGNYRLFYLKNADGDTYAPYVLSSDGATFEKLKFAVRGGNTYIFAEYPSDMKAPNGYYETNVKIDDFNIPAFAYDNPELRDFYYLYCFFDNGYRTYRYDSREDVIQRCPDFKLITAEDNSIPENAGFVARFKSLSSNAKLIVVGLLLAVIGAVVLIIMLAVKLAKNGKRLADFEDENSEMLNEGFDDVKISDSGEPDITDAAVEQTETEPKTENTEI